MLEVSNPIFLPPVRGEDESGDVLSTELRANFDSLKNMLPPKKRQRKSLSGNQLKSEDVSSLLSSVETPRCNLVFQTATLIEQEMTSIMNGIEELECLLDNCSENTDGPSLIPGSISREGDTNPEKKMEKVGKQKLSC